MQRSLLDFTQEVLSSLGSDEVNSIDDTIESQSVSKIVRRSFYNIVDRSTLKGKKDMFSLEASTDVSKPTLMTKPSDVRNIDWVKYDTRSVSHPNLNMQLVEYVSPEYFTQQMYQLSTSNTNVQSFTHTIDTSTITFLITNDRAPTMYTSFNDSELFFNSYDNAIDSTLQKSKTVCYGEKLFIFSLTDSFIPPLSDEQQNLLLNEAISLAWVELKQSGHQKAEMNSRRGFVHQQKVNQTIPTKQCALDQAPNFGRK